MVYILMYLMRRLLLLLSFRRRLMRLGLRRGGRRGRRRRLWRGRQRRRIRRLQFLLVLVGMEVTHPLVLRLLMMLTVVALPVRLLPLGRLL